MTESSNHSVETKRVFLRGWRNDEGVGVVLAHDSGTIEVLGGDHTASHRCHGFFHVFDGRIRSAVFVLHGRLLFQLETQRWDWVDNRVRIEHRCYGSGLTMRHSASVFAEGKLHLEVAYTPAVVELIRAGDMTFDGIDETSDWWFWLSRIVSNPHNRQQLLPRWQPGI